LYLYYVSWELERVWYYQLIWNFFLKFQVKLFIIYIYCDDEVNSRKYDIYVECWEISRLSVKMEKMICTEWIYTENHRLWYRWLRLHVHNWKIIRYFHKLRQTFNSVTCIFRDFNNARGVQHPFEFIDTPLKWNRTGQSIFILKNKKSANLCMTQCDVSF